MLLVGAVIGLALMMAAAVAFSQTAYTLRTEFEYDESFGLRISNGSDSGTGTGSLDLFTDGAKAWTVDQWAGGLLVDSAGAEFRVARNDATTLAVTGTPANGAYNLYGGWRGWNILGATDNPYDFVDEYPEDGTDIEVKRLQIDLQDRGVLYPRIYATKGDTGRVLRLQLLDGGNPVDLSACAVLVYSFAQDNDAKIREGDSIMRYVSDAENGYIEWVLDDTLDTTDSCYFFIKIDDGSVVNQFPASGYIYIDVQDYSTTTYTSGTVRPDILIRAGAWTGKNVTFNFQDRMRNPIDLSGVTVQMNTAEIAHAPSLLASTTSCTTGGACTFGITGAKFASASTVYGVNFKFTSPSGEYVYVPARGYVILETE